jgi:hypothetical protein
VDETVCVPRTPVKRRFGQKMPKTLHHITKQNNPLASSPVYSGNSTYESVTPKRELSYWYIDLSVVFL